MQISSDRRITVWTSVSVNDKSIYAYLSEFEKLSGIAIDVKNAPFSLVIHTVDKTTPLIQTDGIQWFIDRCPDLAWLLPAWVKERLEIRVMNSGQKVQHALDRLKQITELTEPCGLTCSVLLSECQKLIVELETGVKIDRSA